MASESMIISYHSAVDKKFDWFSQRALFIRQIKPRQKPAAALFLDGKGLLIIKVLDKKILPHFLGGG